MKPYCNVVFILYLLYTCDIPKPDNTIIVTFSDDTAIIAIGNSFEEVAEKGKSAINKIIKWTGK